MLLSFVVVVLTPVRYNYAMEAEDFRCPVCRHHLEPSVKDSYVCPQKHGILIEDGHLSNEDGQVLQQIEAREGSDLESGTDNYRSITCPHCEAKMDYIDYNFTGVMIDACTRCNYRWIDQDQLAKTKSLPMTLAPADATFISKLDF